VSTATAQGEQLVVQFCHPGGEHDPGPADVMPWNTGAHARKFLRSPGRYVDAKGDVHEGTVTFWGEWEAQSRVVSRYRRGDAEMPRFLHEPFVQRPGDLRSARQNTDPFVFGDAFLYSNCRQLTSALNPSRMQALGPGSIILFGSKLNHRFVLDTLMVTGPATPYVIGGPDESGGDVPEVFRAAALEPLAASRKLAGSGAMLYRGVMHDPARPDMYSFVPVRADGQPFARPSICLKDLVNPASGQSAKSTPVSADRALNVWKDVAEQIRGEHGLQLAVRLDEPEIMPGQAAWNAADAADCTGRRIPVDRQSRC
jgi:hypothetical protein